MVKNCKWNRVGDHYVHQVADLSPDTFHEGWLTCLPELGTPLEHPAWTTMKSAIVLLDPLEPYSPMLLPGFNEEE